MRFRFVGTGDSAQVPCFGCDCRICARARVIASARRGPCSAEIEVEGQRYLIDAGQMDLATRCEHQRPGAILLTHYHADHAQGLLHLRWGCGASIPVYGPKDSQGCADLHRHPGILDFQVPLKPFRPLHLSSLTVTPVPLNHSKPTLGYCLEVGESRLAYLTDTCGLPGATERFLRKWRPDVVVLDCGYPSHVIDPRNHNTLALALQIIERLSVPMAYLTHIGHELDCELADGAFHLPANVRVARDGEEVSLPPTDVHHQ
ncbi:phosphonate metabolism protein PhnP [Halomonas sp. KAO]|uniref:phosphonate metabolism protein PhnP n=1 Tax=Halomonas sp. KAO TaxID=2783858 RepID=UPI00189FF3A7|nr:phosphonate metabolism protein PhnP [Halomonas sp. KAO]MBF7053499.1 phosphonate metabolism protein PhnP [Halomonas sp. KAO]